MGRRRSAALALAGALAASACGSSESASGQPSDAGADASSDAMDAGRDSADAAVESDTGVPNCTLCATDYTCAKPGFESTTLEITSNDASGCAALLHSAVVRLQCEPRALCFDGGDGSTCSPIADDAGVLAFEYYGPVTCYPNSK